LDRVMFTLTLLGVQVCGERLRTVGKFEVPCTFVHSRRYFVETLDYWLVLPLYSFDKDFVIEAGESILFVSFPRGS